MAKKVSELPVAQIASDTDLYPVVQSGQSRKQTLVQIKTAILGGNVAALAGLTGAADRGFYFTGPSAMSLYTLSSLGRTLGGIANAVAGRAALVAAASGANSDILSLSGLTTALSVAQGGTGNTTGVAATATALATSRSISTTGDATWTVNFNGTANATAAITLAASGVGAGTYGSVTVNTKGLVTSASVATPVANGGTGQTTIAAAALDLAVPKLAWTSYTPTVTATTGTFTSISATGKYLVASGICHLQVVITVTTVGTGTKPVITLPVPALTGCSSMPIPAREGAINGKVGAAVISGALNTALMYDYALGDLVTGNGAVIYVNGSYPVA